MSLKIDSELQAIKQRFEIVGNADKLNNAIRVAMQVAPTDMSVLITGESGAGKTEATKIFLRYITAQSQDNLDLQQRIASTNPVMESFGKSYS